MVIHIHSKDKFVNNNTPNRIFLSTQNTPLYTHKSTTKLVTFITNETKFVLLG
jgi:hypothetical protein